MSDETICVWTHATMLSDGSEVVDIFIEQQADKLQVVKFAACSANDASDCIRKIERAIDAHCLNCVKMEWECEQEE